MADFRSLLTPLYGVRDGARLASRVKKLIARHAAKGRRTGRRHGGQSGGYARRQLYVTYPDAFRDGRCRPGFATLTKQLPRIRAMGFDAVHVLPFLKSPMIDGGFDVEDYLTIRKELGGKRAFDQFLRQAGRLGVRVFMDIILNHVSERSAWFRAAQRGRGRFREFFVSSKERPAFIRKYRDGEGVWAVYAHKGRKLPVWVVFPEQAGEIPHWRRARDGHWYYHTFYPQQLDVNWANPEVFWEFAQILSYWAAHGLSFRLDAIPFVGKEVYMDERAPTTRTHRIICALREVVRSVNPDSVFLAEASSGMPELKRYFGSGRRRESELAYNFTLCSGMWCALVRADPAFVWEALRAMRNIPAHAQWVTFLRNHDGLGITCLDKRTQHRINSELLRGGLPFSDGVVISGRTSSLLGDDPRRHVAAYALLASLPGLPALIYGDEFAKKNDFVYMRRQTRLKQRSGTPIRVADDTRDINRGEVSAAELNTPQAKAVSGAIGRIFRARAAISEIATSMPQEISGQRLPQGVAAGRYRLAGREVCFLINLTSKKREMSLEMLQVKRGRNCHVLLAENGAGLSQNSVCLPAYGAMWLVGPARPSPMSPRA